MLTNVEIIKGDVGHNIMRCLLGWVINRSAQIVETLPKLARAFVGMDCQVLFKKFGESPVGLQCYTHVLVSTPSPSHRRPLSKGKTLK